MFLIAWRRLDDLPQDELPWLLAASRNVIGTLWRGDDRRARLQDRLEQEPSSPAIQEAGLDPELATALGRLDAIDRELLLLVYWEGLDPEGAAAVLEISRDALNQRIHRARERLRALCLEGKVSR